MCSRQSMCVCDSLFAGVVYLRVCLYLCRLFVSLSVCVCVIIYLVMLPCLHAYTYSLPVSSGCVLVCMCACTSQKVLSVCTGVFIDACLIGWLTAWLIGRVGWLAGLVGWLIG